MMRRMPSVFAGALSGSALTAGGVWNFDSSTPAVAVRGPHRGDVGTDVVEPDDAVHPTPLERRLAFQLHAEFGEERFGSLEVVDNDENVVHPLKRHFPGAPLEVVELGTPSTMLISFSERRDGVPPSSEHLRFRARELRARSPVLVFAATEQERLCR